MVCYAECHSAEDEVPGTVRAEHGMALQLPTSPIRPVGN